VLRWLEQTAEYRKAEERRAKSEKEFQDTQGLSAQSTSLGAAASAEILTDPRSSSLLPTHPNRLG
jgi:hypothetical protein